MEELQEAHRRLGVGLTSTDDEVCLSLAMAPVKLKTATRWRAGRVWIDYLSVYVRIRARKRACVRYVACWCGCGAVHAFS